MDLQLLFAFDALMSERQVTRAARQVGVSQPAMSHMLARLRDQFGDPLLVRTTRGMEPTPRALALVDPVRHALGELQQLFATQDAFDPRTSDHVFNIRMGDMNELLLLPGILQAMQEEAPGVSMRVNHLAPSETVEALDAGAIDFAISTRLTHPKSIRSIDLLHDRLICLMRAGHPWAKRRWTVEQYLDLRHINIVQALEDTRFSAADLRRGQHRRVMLNIPHWLAAPSLVERTDLVASISERMARRFNDHGQFVLRELPVGKPALVWRLYWHRRHQTLPAHVWVRDLVQRACAAI